MRALSECVKADRKAKKKKKERARQRELAKIQLELEKSTHVIEDQLLKRLYPNVKMRGICLRNIPGGLREQFHAKCTQEKVTVGGKIRWLMWASVNNLFDEKEINAVMSDLGPLVKLLEARIETKAATHNSIPAPLREDFKRWCVIRGTTMGGRIRQLMIAYVKGVI